MWLTLVDLVRCCAWPVCLCARVCLCAPVQVHVRLCAYVYLRVRVYAVCVLGGAGRGGVRCACRVCAGRADMWASH